PVRRSEEHTSELQSPVVISYAVFCLKKKNKERHLGDTELEHGYDADDDETFLKQELCHMAGSCADLFFFFNDTATTEIYTTTDTLSLHDALPIYPSRPAGGTCTRQATRITVWGD